MNVSKIMCETCERSWARVTAFSVYERQSLESRPCPHCGAYTLSCPEPVAENQGNRPRREREALRVG